MKEHPIDPAFEEDCTTFDGLMSEEIDIQMLARGYRQILDENPE